MIEFMVSNYLLYIVARPIGPSMDAHLDHVEAKKLWSLNWNSGWITRDPPPSEVADMP